ncbi:hypothetical protein [Limnoglobus roseus]|uniref:Phage major capsid protein n=1 Tax=Limnoglobus roseus TaxID=2598579 RepID=A0A5C1A6B9_9BACT|nr:hypothetical protein [Limnoglobus roseus]QEL14779.1 hypothetical protein PX52LOC_01673 [Limnoglobus roseus]
MKINPEQGVQFATMQAAADYLGNGAIEVNMYENEIFDLVRRSSPIMERVRAEPATGHPHRFFEETAIAQGAFSDPRTISYSAGGPTRQERVLYIKAMVNGSNFGLFDVQVTQQQGQFDYVEAKDINDIISGIQVARCQAMWQGTDTSYTSPATIQYFGLLNQVSQQATIAPGASIIDGLKAQVAKMVANTSFMVRPTAIWVNPIVGDLIDREAKAQQITMNTVEVVGGVKVKSLSTQAGELPILSDPFLPSVPSASGGAYGFSAAPAGYQNYFCAILSENHISRPYIDGGKRNGGIPQLFQLGLVGDLQKKFVAVLFDAVLAKGSSYAHAIVAVQRP